MKDLPEGQIVISIPYGWIPIITRNLQEMTWTPPLYEGREKAAKVRKRLQESSA